jgi:hypothetical protein
MFLAQSNDFKELPKYKFYDELTYNIMESSNELGTPIRSPMEVLKKSLLVDLGKQKKIQEIRSSAYCSFVIASLITWLFSYYSSVVLSFKMSLWTSLSMIIWQLIGLSSYKYVITKLEKKKLKDFDHIFNKVYSFRLLSMAGVCVNELIARSRISELYDLKVANLQHHLSRFEMIIEHRIKHGSQIDSELLLFIDELWDLYDQHSIKFQKFMTILKFIWLCLFFFSTYLVGIFSILNSFNI